MSTACWPIRCSGPGSAERERCGSSMLFTTGLCSERQLLPCLGRSRPRATLMRRRDPHSTPANETGSTGAIGRANRMLRSRSSTATRIFSHYPGFECRQTRSCVRDCTMKFGAHPRSRRLRKCSRTTVTAFARILTRSMWHNSVATSYRLIAPFCRRWRSKTRRRRRWSANCCRRAPIPLAYQGSPRRRAKRLNSSPMFRLNRPISRIMSPATRAAATGP